MAVALSRKLGRQVKEALKTVEVFINSTQPTQDSTNWDKIRVKLNELNMNLNEIIKKLDQDIATDGRGGDDNVKTSGVIADYRMFMTRVSKNRNPSALRELATLYYSMPDSLFLGVGTPNSDLYPFESVLVNLKDGTTLEMSGERLKMVLSYLPSAGYGPLQTLFKDFQDKFHGLQDWDVKDVLVTSGAQEGTALTINMLLGLGDPLLVQNPVYPGFAEIIRPMEVDAIPVNVDGDGMIPEHLIQVLEERSNLRDKAMPKAIYINPTASNPTGTLLTDDRKKQIYRIAQQYDLIILEDDPYYFVHFRDRDPVSFLSMDTDHRVIRFDSFSKTLSAGLRLGYVTAPKPFIDRINLHMQVTTMHASGISQLVIHELLLQWGYELVPCFSFYINSVCFSS
uniref:Kynurenine/alpha-aminoadipate aminotransferase, mitochondrial n=2 Tax=Cacopsylla melanoneura TaxID=428564 RepID=A0A8D8ME81_9HEMI